MVPLSLLDHVADETKKKIAQALVRVKRTAVAPQKTKRNKKSVFPKQ